MLVLSCCGVKPRFRREFRCVERFIEESALGASAFYALQGNGERRVSDFRFALLVAQFLLNEVGIERSLDNAWW